MKHVIGILIFLIGFNKISSQTSSIEFSELELNSILKKADKLDKLIFVDMTATWCGPCKLMEKTTFVNDSVTKFLSKNFLSKKIYIDSTYQDSLSQRLINITSSVPTYYFLDSTGNTILKENGFKDAKSFILIAKKSFKLKDTPQKIKKMDNEYFSMKTNKSFLIEYMGLYNQIGIKKGSALEDYLKLIPETNYLSENIITTIIDNESSIKGKGYSILSNPVNRRTIAMSKTKNPQLDYEMYKASLDIIFKSSQYAIESNNPALLDESIAEYMEKSQDKMEDKKLITKKLNELFESKRK